MDHGAQWKHGMQRHVQEPGGCAVQAGMEGGQFGDLLPVVLCGETNRVVSFRAVMFRMILLCMILCGTIEAGASMHLKAEA